MIKKKRQFEAFAVYFDAGQKKEICVTDCRYTLFEIKPIFVTKKVAEKVEGRQYSLCIKRKIGTEYFNYYFFDKKDDLKSSLRDVAELAEKFNKASCIGYYVEKRVLNNGDLEIALKRSYPNGIIFSILSDTVLEEKTFDPEDSEQAVKYYKEMQEKAATKEEEFLNKQNENIRTSKEDHDLKRKMILSESLSRNLDISLNNYEKEKEEINKQFAPKVDARKWNKTMKGISSG